MKQRIAERTHGKRRAATTCQCRSSVPPAAFLLILSLVWGPMCLAAIVACVSHDVAAVTNVLREAAPFVNTTVGAAVAVLMLQKRGDRNDERRTRKDEGR